MAFTIALAGKGGTGKTTTAALVTRALDELGARSVLAVDADPNSTLHEALGVEVERSVGEITEEMMQSGDSTPGGMSKDAWMELNVQRYVVETSPFDLISMGRPEGAGCYCYSNNLVRGCMDGLSRSYEYVVMDNEAGLEHMSRRTTRDVDVLLIVSDPSVRGIRTAERVAALADELGIGTKARYLVVNRASEPLDAALTDAIDATGVELLAVIPNDRGVVDADLVGVGLFELDGDSVALAKVREMLRNAVPALADGASVR